MSSGHRTSHKHKLTSEELDDLLDEALADPKIKAHLARPHKLNWTYDIPYIGSSSIDGATVYFDRHLPRLLPVGGRKLPVTTGLTRHERLEQTLEDEYGWPYPLSHQVATHWEHRDYLRRGFRPEAVEKAYAPYIKSGEGERITRVPADLDLRPELQEKDTGLIARIYKAQDAQKKTHASVKYENRSANPRRSCAKCVMFIMQKYGGPRCTDVVDPIYPAGTCRIFSAGKLEQS